MNGTDDGPLFRPVRNNRTGELERALNANSLYRNIVRKYGQATGLNIEVTGLCVHSMRATAATNALSHEADIAKVQEWLGHANVSTTRLYDRRKNKPEDSPTFECGIKHQTLNKRRTIPLSAKSSRRAHQPARSVVLRRATRMPYP